MGSISIDGDIQFDYIMTNRDFQVPNTLYPNRELIEIVTKHHHLFDNSEIEKITLRGTASDGVILEFDVTKDPINGWAPGSSPMFEVSWSWDDVDNIRWVAQAVDSTGESVWPAVSFSGQSGAKAVENDIQVDSFEVRDMSGRLLSNQFSPFYPFPVLYGSDMNISGTVRFQDSTSHRPHSSDYAVGLNLSGNLFALSSIDEGGFSGIITPPSSLSELALSPMMLVVGPTGSATGAEDVTGVPPQVIVTVDYNPPTLGPLEVNTDIGLQPAHGKVWEPGNPLTIFVTSDEAEARGESITLRYWREGTDDDANSDGVADEDEYLSLTMPMTSGMTGQQHGAHVHRRN